MAGIVRWLNEVSFVLQKIKVSRSNYYSPRKWRHFSLSRSVYKFKIIFFLIFLIPVCVAHLIFIKIKTSHIDGFDASGLPASTPRTAGLSSQYFHFLQMFIWPPKTDRWPPQHVYLYISFFKPFFGFRKIRNRLAGGSTISTDLSAGVPARSISFVNFSF